MTAASLGRSLLLALSLLNLFYLFFSSFYWLFALCFAFSSMVRFLPSVGPMGTRLLGFRVSSPYSTVVLGFDILTMDEVSSFPSCSPTDLTLDGDN